MPQDKRKLTEAEVGMAKSLTKLKTPMTKKEELQAVTQRAKLLKENKALESKQYVSPSKRVLPGKNMLTVPSVAKRLMEKKAGIMKQKMNEPTSTKRVVAKFTSYLVPKNPSSKPSESVIRDSRTGNVIGKRESKLVSKKK